MDIISFATPPSQPRPLSATVEEITTPEGTTKVIHRTWNPGDSWNCSLCDECTADHDAGTCVVTIAPPIRLASTAS